MKTLEELKSIERIVTTETALITNSNGTFTMKTLLDQLITVQSALEEQFPDFRLCQASDDDDTLIIVAGIGDYYQDASDAPAFAAYLKQKEATDATA